MPWLDLEEELTEMFAEAPTIDRRDTTVAYHLAPKYHHQESKRAAKKWNASAREALGSTGKCETCSATIRVNRAPAGNVRRFCDARCHARWDYARRAAVADLSPLRSATSLRMAGGTRGS